MGKLLYHRSHLDAAAHPNLIRITNLGHCKLRLINCQDTNDIALITVDIIDKNAPLATEESLSIFYRMQQIAAAIDIGWEGDIELAADQDLRVLFEDAVGTAPTALDDLWITIGYEPLE